VPADSPLLIESPGAADQELQQLIAAGDGIALLALTESLPQVVRKLREAGDTSDVGIPLTNIAATAALCLRHGKAGVADSALEAIMTTARLADVKAIQATTEDHQLWEAVAGSLWTLGAVASDLQAWPFVRSIVDRTTTGERHYESWLRQAQVLAARGNFDSEDDNILDLAMQRLASRSSFGMTDREPAEREQAAAGFDQLALIVTRSLPNTTWQSFYPSYAKYQAARVEPLVIELRQPSDMRTAIFPGTDTELRDILQETNEIALMQASQYRAHGKGWAYEGYQDARTWAFVRAGQMFEEWG
jgi:hypothetical protein